MTDRAISHQIVIAITRQHATLMTLWTFFFLLRDDSLSDIFHASTHPLHRSNNKHTRQRSKPRFHSSQKCHDFVSSVAVAALQLPLWSAVSLRLFSLHSDAVVIFTDAELPLSLSLVDSSFLAFIPALEEYFKNIPLKSGPLTSTQRKSFD